MSNPVQTSKIRIYSIYIGEFHYTIEDLFLRLKQLLQVDKEGKVVLKRNKDKYHEIETNNIYCIRTIYMNIFSENHMICSKLKIYINELP